MDLVPHIQSSSMFHLGDRPSYHPGHHRISSNLESPHGSLLRHNIAISPLQIQAQIIIVSGVRSGTVTTILWHKSNRAWLMRDGKTSPRSRAGPLRANLQSMIILTAPHRTNNSHRELMTSKVHRSRNHGSESPVFLLWEFTWLSLPVCFSGEGPLLLSTSANSPPPWKIPHLEEFAREPVSMIRKGKTFSLALWGIEKEHSVVDSLSQPRRKPFDAFLYFTELCGVDGANTWMSADLCFCRVLKRERITRCSCRFRTPQYCLSNDFTADPCVAVLEN